MIKYIFISVLIFQCISFCIAQKDKEVEIAQKVNILTEQKEWDKANDLVTNLLKEYPKSNYRENYFYALEWIISEQIWKIRWKSKIPPDTTIPVGSLTIHISSFLNPIIERLYKDRINLAENYLNEFPNGLLITKIYQSLIGSYAAIGKHDLAIEISKDLFEKEDTELKLLGAIELGKYAHVRGEYSKAIDYYRYVIENKTNTEQEIQYSFYVANCFYELGKIDESKIYLNKVFSLSNESENKDYEKIAEVMWEFIEIKNKDTELKRRNFIFFKDAANE